MRKKGSLRLYNYIVFLLLFLYFINVFISVQFESDMFFLKKKTINKKLFNIKVIYTEEMLTFIFSLARL